MDYPLVASPICRRTDRIIYDTLQVVTNSVTIFTNLSSQNSVNFYEQVQQVKILQVKEEKCATELNMILMTTILCNLKIYCSLVKYKRCRNATE